MAGSTVYHQLLQEFLRVTRPDGSPDEAQHDTVHHITKTGPSVAQKPKSLARDRLIAAKKQFEEMMRLGIARPSERPWKSPLHMVPKKVRGDR
jgi:cleavage and polyadenylation specificity factor subunit 1